MTRRSSQRAARRPPLGQHFLHDPALQARIVDLLSPAEKQDWLEIGPGHGEITTRLASTAGTIVAVEKDPALAQELGARLARHPQAEIMTADILTTSPTELARQRGVARWRVYGSLPYYITSPILHLLFDHLKALRDIHVIVQKEVAERVAATPHTRDYGYLSVVCQFFTRPEILLPVPRGAFRPPPRVDSVLLALQPRTEFLSDDPSGFLRFARQAFHLKRKTLPNNLRGACPPELLQSALEELGQGPKARAEELSVGELVRLYQALLGGSPPVENGSALC